MMTGKCGMGCVMSSHGDPEGKSIQGEFDCVPKLASIRASTGEQGECGESSLILAFPTRPG